ncbi:TOBE domain-containing protein [Rhodococcus hoagii]|nr:TOBE domain-containing protein [Prescottella equi]
MILRPEVVGLQSAESTDFRAEGIVRDIAFLGARTSVRVELADGRVITAGPGEPHRPCRRHPSMRRAGFRGAAPTCGR